MSGWDLVYDNNGYIEIDPEQCGYSSFLGAAVPEAVRTDVGQEKMKEREEEDDDMQDAEREVELKKSTRRRSKFA